MGYPGTEKLRRWRDAEGHSQEHVSKLLIPRVTQAAVCKWESESESGQRPDIARALQLEGITHGEVRAVDWGYSAEEVSAVGSAFREPTTSDGWPTGDTHPPREV